MGKYFGTDGFRGKVGEELTAPHAYQTGRFIGWYYGKRQGKRARILIGKDTRRSGYMLEYSICAGICASGADAYIMHVTTTPSVAYITRIDDFDCGVMISASHNPFYDNGIKLISSRGEKIDDKTISQIEDYIDLSVGQADDKLPLSTGEEIGRIVDYVSGRNRYIGYLVSLASHSYRGMRIGLDCANGSAWSISRAVFEALGAKTYVIGASPDGTNINRGCGSTHIGLLKEFVSKNGLDAGFAYDGDADRCIAVDECGKEVNGDKIIYIFAKMMAEQGALDKNTVVATVMSNLGLFRALDKAGINCEKTQVGDRFVYEKMTEKGYKLGGEQSGHIIIQKYATTGDGILTSLMLCEQMLDKKTKLSSLAADVVMTPQVTLNIPVGDKDSAVSDAGVLAETERISELLGEKGRVLLRKSGTENVVRVMVECDDAALCAEYAERIAGKIKAMEKG